MGTVYRAECPNCSYSQELCLGGGLGSINLLRNIRVLDETEQKKVMEMHEAGKVGSFLAENELAECRDCGLLEEKAIIRITSKSGLYYVFGRQCRSCGKELHIYKPDENGGSYEVKCPMCREALLAFAKVGHWD